MQKAELSLNEKKQLSDNTKGILFACTTAFLWGFLPIILKVSLNDLDPVTITWFRFFIAFSILFIFSAISKRDYLEIIKNPPILSIIAGICLGLNYIGFINGVKITTPGNAQILIQMGPILLILAGIIIFKEKVSKKQSVGFLIACLGFLLFYNDQIRNLINSDYNKGILWIIFAALVWVVYAIFQKQMVKNNPAQKLNLIIYGIPAVMFIPFANFSSFFKLNILGWIIIIFLGINTLIAYGSLSEAFKYLDANKVSIIITLNPIITLITMTAFSILDINWVEHEKISSIGLTGAICVISGAVLAISAKKK